MDNGEDRFELSLILAQSSAPTFTETFIRYEYSRLFIVCLCALLWCDQMVISLATNLLFLDWLGRTFPSRVGEGDGPPSLSSCSHEPSDNESSFAFESLWCIQNSIPISAPTLRADVPGASKLFSGLTRRDAFSHQRKGLQESLSLYADQKSEDMEPHFWKYYAVAVGRTPGLYSHWDDAREQVMGFKGPRCGKFMDRSDAIQYMREYGFADAEIRVFRKTFKPSSSFEPNPTATFQDEFKAFAATQTWKQEEARKAKIDTIVGELIYHYLPEGIAADQEDEDGSVDLTD